MSALSLLSLSLALFQAGPPVDEPKVYSSWPITFLQGPAAKIENGEIKVESPDPEKGNPALSKLAEALNSVYGAGTVVPAGQSLLIRGSADTVFAVKEALAKWIDVPFPQVKLDFWVYQGSERLDRDLAAGELARTISAGASMVKAYEGALLADLEAFVRDEKVDPDLSAMRTDLNRYFALFRISNPAGEVLDIDNTRGRHGPFEDTLLLSALSGRRGFQDRMTQAFRGKRAASALHDSLSLLRARREEVRGADPGQAQANTATLEMLARLISLGERLERAGGYVPKDSSDIKSFDPIPAAAPGKPFASFCMFMECGSSEVDSRSILDMLKAYDQCSLKVKDGRTDPALLAILASTTDTMLKRSVDAISSDFRKMAVQPLVDWIQEVLAKSHHRNGIRLIGNSSLTVSSSRVAANASTAENYLPYTPPSRISGTDLESLVKGLSGIPATSSAAAGSLLKFLLESNPPATNFTSIAPGLTVSSRPTVLPGSRSARLELDFRQAINTIKPAGDWDPSQGRLDSVTSQLGKTDASVDMFDLLDISGFSMQTTGPGDYRWQIPGLSGIPLLGGMFRGPRSTLTTVHRGFVIVHTTILPRTLDIAQRHGN